jgi:flagellar basal-body rod modification protein FlgD
MSVSSTNSQSAITQAANPTTGVTNPNGVLKKNDFLKLLLTQLQYQDPTAPTDTAKILSQTSQLATLEASTNTQKALDNLAASLGTAQQFSTISAIGKTADLGSDAITLKKGKSSTFEVYFPKAVQKGSIVITDKNGATVKTLDVGTNPAGVYKFTWDGTDSATNAVNGGIYHVNATYSDSKGVTQSTRLGAYPIEAVRFDKGKTLVKVGSNYVPLANIKEVY